MSTMAKSNRKTRLQTYHAKDVGSVKCKSVLLSNTSKRLQKVVTSVPVPASSHTKKLDGDAEMIVDEDMDFHAKVNTDLTSLTDLEHPAALRI